MVSLSFINIYRILEQNTNEGLTLLEENDTMTEIDVSEQQIIQALIRIIMMHWKPITLVLVFFAALFFAGGTYVYNTAKLDTQAVMIDLYNEVNKAKDKAEKAQAEMDRLVEEMQKAADEFKKRRQEIIADWEIAEDTFDHNINEMNELIKESYRLQDELIERVNELKETNARIPHLFENPTRYPTPEAVPMPETKQQIPQLRAPQLKTLK